MSPRETPASHKPDTKESLLDAAETLFAEQGIDGASLRSITSKAGANLAAAHYHFGSKEALVRAVLARHLGPINRRRLEMLDAAEAGDAPPTLQQIVRAFVEPVVRFGHDQPDRGRHFAQLAGRAMTSPVPTLRRILIDELGETISRFRPAFARALPHLSPPQLFWRIHFMVGTMAHTVGSSAMVEEVSAGLCDTQDLDATLEHLVTFLEAGLAAPAPGDGSITGDRES